MHETNEALRALRAPDQRGQGRVDWGRAIQALTALDLCAQAYRSWTPHLIPGILQTDAYAAAALRLYSRALPAAEASARIQARSRRAKQFFRLVDEGRIEPTFIVGGGALRHPLGGVPEHAEQLGHLLDRVRRHGLDLRVVPEFSPLAAAIEPYSLYALASGQRVGYHETLLGGHYSIRPEDIAHLYSAHADLYKLALDPEGSKRVIAEVLQRCLDLCSSSQATATPEAAWRSPGPRPDPSE